MKYAIWRHENALGNSAEHTVGLCKHLYKTKDKNPEIYVEKDFQKYFAMCIPDVSPDKIYKFEDGIFDDINTITIKNTFENKIFTQEKYKDLIMPYCYAFNGLSYNSMWEHLSETPEATLKFPYKNHENKHNLPKNGIIIQIREANTFWKRIDGGNSEPYRFVNINTFFNIAKYFADNGYIVIRIGDDRQTPMPEHKNIFDFAMINDRTILDDLYLISESKVFLSCDSGMWPMAGGMKKNMVLSNVVSGINKPSIVNWLPKETTKVLFKKQKGIHWQDNSFDELRMTIESFL